MTIRASDGSVASIMALQAQSVAGDTITVPPGIYHWSTEVSITKNISLIGGNTTNIDAGTAGKETLIVDDKTDGNRLISFRSNGAAVGPRVSGLAFTKGTWTTPNQWALFEIFGTSPVRIDHCYVDTNFAVPNEVTGFITQYLLIVVAVENRNYGVIDHCVFPQLVGVVRCYWGDQTDKGDLDWTLPAGFGGPNWFFVEDNWMVHGTDIHQGGKLVVRHNHLHGELHSQAVDTISALIVSHGIGRGQTNERGGRAYEVYNNDFHWHQTKDLDGLDCGTGVFWGNRWTNAGFATGGIALDYYRQVHNFGAPFFQADGNNPWDLNDATTHTLLRGIDQPGCGAGDMINRAAPAWPHQALEPPYEWDNTSDGPVTNIQFKPHVYNTQLHQGVDYYDDTPMPGYTPFPYPHPLTQTEMITLTGNTATAETITLTWTGALGTTVDIYRDGALFAGAVPNSGTYVTTETGGGIGVSHVWEVRGNTASNDVTLV